MSERRALLDPDMYKISEEDSQDEEVLSSSLPHKLTTASGRNGEGNNNVRSKTKPVPPVKPAFLRKNPNATNININSGNLNTKQSSSGSHQQGKNINSGSNANNSKPKLRSGNGSSSSIFRSRSLPDKTSSQCTLDAVEWPSSTSTSSSSSNSGEGSSGDESRLTGGRLDVGMVDNASSRTRGQSYKEMRRKKKAGKKAFRNDGAISRGNSTNQQGLLVVSQQRKGLRTRNLPNQSYQVGESEAETDDEESGTGSSTQSGSESCSSCDNHQQRGRIASDNSGRYPQSDDNASTGSYSTQCTSTDHPDSPGSDMDFGDEDLYSEYLEDEDSLPLITETEVQSWTNEEGNILLCEYFSETSSPDTLESVNEPAGTVPNRKSKQIQTSSSSTSLKGATEIGQVSPNVAEGNADNAKVEKGTKIYSGKISRLLKRGRSSKDGKIERPQDLPPTESFQGSSKYRQAVQISSNSKKSQESKMKSKGNGSGGAPEKVFRFKDEHEGEKRQVEISIASYSSHNLGRRATMVESLLGIIPSRFSYPSVATSQHAVSDRPSSKTTSFTKNRPTSLETTEDRRIMVAGFIPDGPAARNRLIKIGDWLQNINGIAVDFLNVNNVLLETAQQDTGTLENADLKINLGLQRVSGYTVTDSPTRNHALGEDKTLNGRNNFRDLLHHSPRFSEPEISSEIMSNIAVLYISVVCIPPSPPLSKEKTKDVIFAWPKESESRKVSAMSASHGMFSTLYKLLRDVTGSHPISSRVMIDDEEIDVVFSSDDQGKGLLLLATAATLSNFSICQPHSTVSIRSKENQKKEKKIRWKDPVSGGLVLAHRILTRLENLLKYQFGTLSRAFRNTPGEKLNKFLNQALVGLSDISEDFLFLQVHSHFLRIPPRIRCVIDERLYSFETSDSFSLSYRRTEADISLFHCLGSCLYYKGMVVTSHLERNLASHFHGWWRTQLGLWGVKRNTLPCFWDPVRRLVVFQETFQHLERNELQEQDLDSEAPSSILSPCYSVLLGLDNYMLGFVLESAIPDQRAGSVDIGWIRRGLNCISRILNSEIHAVLEKLILSQEKEFIELYPPPGVSDKTVLSGNNGIPSKKVPKLSPAGPTSSILKNPETPPASTFQAVNLPGSSGVVTLVKAVVSGQNNSSRNLLIKENGKYSDASILQAEMPADFHDYSYHHGLSTVAHAQDRAIEDNIEEEEEIDENTTGTGSDTSSFKWCTDDFEGLSDKTFEEGMKTVSVTKGNVLFDFLQVEHGRGVILSSRDIHEGPFSVVIHNFRQSATVSHHILHKAANGRKRLSHQENDKKWVSKALTPISEHGILFNCDVVDPRDAFKKKPRLRQVSYWVIGRIYPNQREVYLCYQDSSVAQNLVEVAFKLAYYSA